MEGGGGEFAGFGNFARIANLCVGSHLGTLHGYCFHLDFWPNLNFPLEHQIKLISSCFRSGVDYSRFIGNHTLRNYLHHFLRQLNIWCECGIRSKNLISRTEVESYVYT